MSRFVAAGKDNRIKIVSDHPITDDQFTVLEVPEELKSITDKELVIDYRVKDGKVVPYHPKYPAKQLKVAIITNHMQKCGISTYAEFLIPELIKHIGDFRLFIEENENPTGPLPFPNKTEICWKRGKTTANLVRAIKKYDPDIIWLQHEYGLFPTATHLLSMLTQLSEYRIITTLHSIFPEHTDKTICEAALKEVIVHSDGAKKALKNKGITNKIHIVEHGCYPITSYNRLWNIYKSEHTFIQQGFGFHYKGMPTSIKAAHILKNKYKDIFLTILFSESPYNKVGHQLYYEELMALIEKLDLQENIGIIRGYQSEEVIDAYYRTNKVAVFPYESEPQHLVYGSSGAIRLAASKQLPVISSNIPHFIGFPSIKINNEDELANAIDKLFASPEATKEQTTKQNVYIEDNSWDKIALKYINIFEGFDI